MNKRWLPGMAPSAKEAPTEKHDGSGDEWFTPPDVWSAVRAALGEEIVDPCASSLSPVDTPYQLDVRRGENGLTDSWGHVHRAAFVNPPYSDVSAWIDRCGEEHRRGRRVIALVPMRPETRAWHRHVWPLADVVQPKGRLRFVGSDGQTHGSAKTTTCFVCWGDGIAHRLAHELLPRATVVLVAQRRFS